MYLPRKLCYMTKVNLQGCMPERMPGGCNAALFDIWRVWASLTNESALLLACSCGPWPIQTVLSARTVKHIFSVPILQLQLWHEGIPCPEARTSLLVYASHLESTLVRLIS